jgi:hypothetical protein
LDCLESLRSQGHSVKRDVGEAMRVLGIVEMGTGRCTEARDSLMISLEIAKHENVLLLEGEVAEGALRFGKYGE